MTQPIPHHRPAGVDVFGTLISAVLFLYVGFGLGYVGDSDSAVYNTSVAAITWGARVVGIGLLVVAGLVTARLPGADWLDLGMAGLATLLCVVVGVIWVAYSDMDGVLLLLFGLVNANATRAAWRRVQRGRAAGPPPFEEQT